MSFGVIRLPVDDVGKRVRAIYVSISGDDTYMEVLALADSSGNLIGVGKPLLVTTDSGQGIVVLQSGAIRVLQSGAVTVLQSGAVTVLQSGPLVVKMSGEVVKISGEFVSLPTTTVVRISGEQVTIASGLVTIRDGAVVKVSGETVDIEVPLIIKANAVLTLSNESGGIVLGTGATRTVTVKAMDYNSGTVYIGGSGANRPYSGFGFALTAGQGRNYDVADLNAVYAMSTISGYGAITYDGVM